MLSAISRIENQVLSWPDSLDALLVAPSHHTLRLENETMGVVRTRIASGQTALLHTHHWPGVFCIPAWCDFIRRDPEGQILLDSRQFADTPRLDTPLWQDAIPAHTGENVGSSEFNAMQVEIKDAPE